MPSRKEDLLAKESELNADLAKIHQLCAGLERNIRSTTHQPIRSSLESELRRLRHEAASKKQELTVVGNELKDIEKKHKSKEANAAAAALMQLGRSTT